MIGLPAGTRIWLVAGATDMRKGFDGLSALVQTALRDDPFSGQLFVFRGRHCVDGAAIISRVSELLLSSR